jgi:hypothetical protein
MMDTLPAEIEVPLQKQLAMVKTYTITLKNLGIPKANT